MVCDIKSGDNGVANRLLGFRLAPPVVGRVIDLTALKSVTSQKLLDTYFMQGR